MRIPLAYSVRPNYTFGSRYNPYGRAVTDRMEIYNVKSGGNHITDHSREQTITKWQR